MNPLGGHIYLLGAPQIAEALRVYSPWWARRNYIVAVTLVFVFEVLALAVVVAMIAK